LDLLIIGAGFAGLYMLMRARRQGLQALVLEAAGGVGGTWYHNRYPGARVDIESLEYSYGFDEALQQQWHWSERYAAQPELLRYAEHVADRFALRDGILLNTRLQSARFDEAKRCWQAQAQAQTQAQTQTQTQTQTETGAAQTFIARHLVLATGALSMPSTPPFAGQEGFRGRVLHTARWPQAPVDVRGLRVGVVGTGSSAVQAVPELAREAASLHVFQRTAAYAVPAHNGPLDPVREAQVKAGYADFRARNLQMRGGFSADLPPHRVSALAVSEAVREAQFEARWQVGGFAFLAAFNDLLTDPAANALAADFVRRKIRTVVKDPVTAERLCPTHTLGCKRLCVDSGYYATFNRPNVHLVDVRHTPIERFSAQGLKVGDRDIPLDLVVLATGFDAMTGTLMALDIRGRAGRTLREHWAGGPLNYLGMMLAEFPNLYIMAGPGSTAAFTNMHRAIEHHGDWIIEAIQHLRDKGLATIEPTAEAEAQWVSHVNALAEGSLFVTCASWYLGANIPGKPRVFMPLLQGFPAYRAHCAQVAQAGYTGCRLAA
jgi:cyclohexanone monooxygenase